MGVEVCIFRFEDAYLAEAAGALRLELCKDYALGGITPDWGCLNRWSGRDSEIGLQVPSVVMVRPRGGDFNYTKREQKWMTDTIKQIAKLGFQGVVFGALQRKSGQWLLNQKFCKEACALSRSLGLETVLHRAFDDLPMPFNAVDQAQDCGFDRILTGWGSQNMESLKMLKWHAQDIQVLPGGGIRLGNLRQYIDLGFKEVHTSALNENGKLDVNQLEAMVLAMKGGN